MSTSLYSSSVKKDVLGQANTHNIAFYIPVILVLVYSQLKELYKKLYFAASFSCYICHVTGVVSHWLRLTLETLSCMSPVILVSFYPQLIKV